MAALLVSIAVMSILMSAAMPVWRTYVKREKEAELVFRGEQYARAVGLFQRKYAGAFPPSVELLVEQRFLRKAYKDPMSPDGEFQILYQSSAVRAPGQPAQGGAVSPSPIVPPSTGGVAQPPAVGQTPLGGSRGTPGAAGGIIGVTSKSREESLRLYNGRRRYNEWQFVYSAVTNQPASAQQPGMIPGRAGQPGTPVPPPGAEGARPSRPDLPPGLFGQSPPR